MSRAETAWVSSRMRSASVDLPWSMCAMIEKLRIRACSTSGDGTDARPLRPWPFQTEPQPHPHPGWQLTNGCISRGLRLVVERVVAYTGESFGFGSGDPCAAVDVPVGAVSLDHPGAADIVRRVFLGSAVFPLPIERPSFAH